MMNEELNKKLAEWVGFKLWKGSLYWYPNDTGAKRLPNFTESPDACFKWLVKKIEDPSISIYKSVLGGNYWVCVLGEKGCMDNVNAMGETPALALCLAIEKLIDSEVKI